MVAVSGRTAARCTRKCTRYRAFGTRNSPKDSETHDKKITAIRVAMSPALSSHLPRPATPDTSKYTRAHAWIVLRDGSDEHTECLIHQRIVITAGAGEMRDLHGLSG